MRNAEVMELEQSEDRTLTTALTGNILLALLLRFFVMLYPNMHMLQSHLFGLLPVLLLFPMLRLPAVRRQKGLLLGACLTLWILFTCLFPTYVESDLYTVLTSFFLTLEFLFITCYSMPFAVGRERMRDIFRLTATVFVVLMTAIMAVADYAALMNISIPNPGGSAYQPACIFDHRLTAFVSSVGTGSYSCITLFLCALLLLDKPHPALRVLYILCIPIVYVAAALSDARIPIVCIAFCIGGLTWLVVTDRLPVRRMFLRRAAALALAGAVMLAFYFGTGLCMRGVSAASTAIAARTATSQAEPEAPAAQAEPVPEAVQAEAEAPAGTDAAQPAKDELAKRPLLFGISTLNGRTDVWMSAIEMFRHAPYKLLIGTSPVFIIRDTQPYLSPDALNDVYPHMHSLPFQTVTALGVPGLLLYAVLLAYIAVHALRVFFLGAGRLTLPERGVALVPLFYTVMDVADVSLWFAPPSSFTTLWFYLAGGYAVYLSTTRIPKKRSAVNVAADCQKGANA